MASKKSAKKTSSPKVGSASLKKKKIAKKTTAKKTKKTEKPKKEGKKAQAKAKPRIRRESYSKSLRFAALSSPTARQKLIDMGGENTIAVLREFSKDMSDEEISRKAGIKASDVRVVLNRLHNEGILYYLRTRDRDSGWYSYLWRINKNKLKDFAKTFKTEQKEVEEETVDGESYVCNVCKEKERVEFERAVEMQFKCDRCGSILDYLEKEEKKEEKKVKPPEPDDDK